MNTLIRDVLTVRDIETTTPNTTVLAAVATMNDRHIGSLLVIEEERPIGILTERDILVRVVEAGRDPATTPVAQVMTRELVLIDLETSVVEAMTIMTERRCRHLPVVDGNRLCGLVSSGDLTAWIVQEHQRTIHDLHDYITH